jgi:hypothetical protein
MDSTWTVNLILVTCFLFWRLAYNARYKEEGKVCALLPEIGVPGHILGNMPEA